MHDKRIPYSNLECLDTELSDRIGELTSEVAKKVICEIGKDYLIQDVQSIFFDRMFASFGDVALQEEYKRMLDENSKGD